MIASDLQQKKPTRHEVYAHVRNRIFAGILFAAPIMLTIWTFNFLLNLATNWFPQHYFDALNTFFNGYFLKLLILVLVILLFYLIGGLSFYLGKRAKVAVDDFFSNIPFVNRIYKFIKRFTDWVENRQDTMFDSVVLVRFPHANSYAVGLVTAKTAPIIANHVRDEAGNPLECLNVFIATTPNPTSGFFLIYPKRDVIFLDMDVSAVLNMVMSAGAVMPDDLLPKASAV